jgi:hypothetical protein
MMTMIYHVTLNWDGQDLQSLAARHEWSDDLADAIAAKWSDCDAGAYYQTEGQYIHCHPTLADAETFLDEFCEGGEILEIDTDSDWFDGRVETGREYPHPVVRRRIAAECVRRVGCEAAR